MTDQASEAPRLWRKKPIPVAAVQWHAHGGDPDVVPYLDVRPEAQPCDRCPEPLEAHGWIRTLEDGHRVCPSDWLITGIQGERYPCKPGIFRDSYEPAEALSTVTVTLANGGQVRYEAGDYVLDGAGVHVLAEAGKEESAVATFPHGQWAHAEVDGHRAPSATGHESDGKVLRDLEDILCGDNGDWPERAAKAIRRLSGWRETGQ